MRRVPRGLAGPTLVLSALLGALWLLHQELQHYTLRDFLDALTGIAPARIWTAVGLTIMSYVILIGYHLLAVRWIQHPLRLPRVALASFLGYAVGNNVGTVLGGSTIRFRLYSAWGLCSAEIVKLVLMLSVTVWIGLLSLAGAVFLVVPLPIPARLHLPFARPSQVSQIQVNTFAQSGWQD